MAAFRKKTTRVRRPTQPDFAQEFKQYYLQQVTSTVRSVAQKGSTRHLELHPSSYPYCPLKHFRDICLKPPADTFDMEFSMEFYTSVGTVVHSVVQNSLGYGKRMLGDWKCNNCKATKEFSVSPKCKKCGSLMEYEELGVKIGKRTIGHVDGVFQLANGRWIVIDYKTTSCKNIMAHRRTGKVYPYHHNTEQIRSYCFYLSRLYGLDICGYLLVYIARDNIMEHIETVGKELSEQDLKSIGKEMKLWDTQHDIIVRAKSVADIQFCIDTKPCQSLRDYQKRYDDKFNPCPMAAVCFDAKMLKMELKQCCNMADHLPLTSEPLACMQE